MNYKRDDIYGIVAITVLVVFWFIAVIIYKKIESTDYFLFYEKVEFWMDIGFVGLVIIIFIALFIKKLFKP